MATVNVTFPDAQIARVKAALVAYGMPANLTNAQARDWLEEYLRNVLRNMVRDAEAGTAASQAAAAARAKVDAEVPIT